METETKQCQNCKQEFVIEPEDFTFYEKIKVPAPTWCPECRMIRRMTWRNERSLFNGVCAQTGENIISMFRPDSDFVVYERDYWWSDKWDPTSYGQEYDFSRPFFEQYKELLARVPLANVGNTNCINSPYGNHNADCKNCYLVYGSYVNEDVMYSYGSSALRDCVDTYNLQKSEQCYEGVLCDSMFGAHYAYDSDQSLNSYFLNKCVNCQDCIGCINLRNKKYHIFNEPYSKEGYEKKKKEFNFGSHKSLEEFKKKYRKFILQHPHKYATILKSVNVTGDNIMHSKNLRGCFDIYDITEDSKYVIHGGLKANDCYDCYGFGGGASFLYEGIDTGLTAAHHYFNVLTHACHNVQYTYMCYNSKNLFGCVSIRQGEYCILNKKYSKEEYEELVPKIIEHMNEMPYTDQHGRIYKYGEFFPPELSPFAYNETIAQEYFPKTKGEIEKSGFSYRPRLERDYRPTIDSKDLLDHIDEADEKILQEVIACPNDGDDTFMCTQAYKIVKSELDFLKKHQLPLPRYCPNCRHYYRLKQRNPFKLWTRACMKEGCNTEFETAYAPDRPEIIYCEKCYQQEVV